MSKYTYLKRFSHREIDELFVDFAKAVSAIRSATEAASFIKDLLSEQEVVMLARRLQIARLLYEGLTYEQIEKQMKVSNTTIAKVHTWMNLYGEGYRTILKRTPRPKAAAQTKPALGALAGLKRKYPMYFWPEILLKEIVASAGQREKARLKKVLADLRQKTKLTKELTKLLNSDKIYHPQ